MQQGKPISAALQHSIFLPSREDADFPAIIAFHGRGADEYDLATMILAMELADIILITPRAPFPLPYGGYAWYDLKDEGVPEPETFRASLGDLEKFVEEAKSGYPIDRDRVLLLGFSQGTVMAYATGLLHPLDFRGIAALSGYIPQRSGLHFQLNELKGFSLFVSHGSADSVIPVRFGREAAELLKQAGADVAYHEYQTHHTITDGAIRDLKEWILKTLTHAE